MNTEFEFSIFLDGKEINNVPKHVAEVIETLMSTGDVLFIKRNPKIIERSIAAETPDSEVLKEIKKMNVIINDSYAKIIEQSNNAVTRYSTDFSEALVPVMRSLNESYAKLLEQSNEAIMKYSRDFSDALAPVMRSLNDLKKDPQTLELNMLTQNLSTLSSRVNDIGVSFSSYLPSMLKDKLDEQKNDIIEHVISSLNPPKEETEKSVEKGQNYENELADTMRELTKRMGYDVQLVGREKDRACDIHVRDIDAKILYAVEAKNYSNTVPGKEVEKFYRDLELLKHDPEYAAYRIIGLFVSTSASIAGHGNFNIDDYGNFFIAGENNNATMLLSIFMLCHRMAYNKKFNEPEDNIDGAEHRKKVILDVHNLLQKNTKMIKVINNQIKNANSIIKDAEDMKSLISPVNEILEEYVKEFELELKKKSHFKQNNKKRVTAMVETESATEEDMMEQEPPKKKTVHAKPKKKYVIKSAPIELESDETVAEWE